MQANIPKPLRNRCTQFDVNILNCCGEMARVKIILKTRTSLLFTLLVIANNNKLHSAGLLRFEAMVFTVAVMSIVVNCNSQQKKFEVTTCQI